MDQLKSKGLFEIIEHIKKIYGQDVAIISCEEINKNYEGNCKKLVTEYMPNFPIPKNASKFHIIQTRNKPIGIYYNKYQIMKLSCGMFDIKTKLSQILNNKKESEYIFGKIKEKARKFLPFFKH